MKRKTVKAALTAYRGIEDEIRQKLQFAQETGEKQYEREAAELRTAKLEIIGALNALPQKERNALWYHYVKGWTWTRVAAKCAYSDRQIRNIANKGLDRLAKALSKSREASDFCVRSAGGYL